MGNWTLAGVGKPWSFIFSSTRSLIQSMRNVLVPLTIPAVDGEDFIDVERYLLRWIEQIAQREIRYCRIGFYKRVLIDCHRGLRGLHDGGACLLRTVIHIGGGFGDLRVHEEFVPRGSHILPADHLVDVLLLCAIEQIGGCEVNRFSRLLRSDDRLAQKFQIALGRLCTSALLQGFLVLLYEDALSSRSSDILEDPCSSAAADSLHR